MIRTKPVLALMCGLAIAAAGCRNCGDRCGWFASRACDPCRQVGRTVPANACFDPVTGVPVSSSDPGTPGMLIPGSGVPVLPGPAGPPSELPMPQPNELIPRPGVPLAPPAAAPADGSVGTLPPPRFGVPVKDN
jgi:hypothetical protein